MTERLIEFTCAASLLVMGSVFVSSALNLKIKRTAFTALLCSLSVLLLLPFLIWGRMFLFYGAFTLWVFVMFAMGAMYSADTRPIVFWAVLPAWVLGPGNMLFANLLQPIALQLWGSEHATLVYAIKAALLVFLNLFYYGLCFLGW